MFITYEEYKKYGGKTDETAFEIYCYEASKKIDASTFGRIKTVTEPVKRCTARLVDLIAKADVLNDNVTSWSNDGISKSFKDVSKDEYKEKIQSVIFEYLSNETDNNGTPLLYLGVNV